MGEYFIWVNADKKEYIDPYDFDYGNKFRESMTRQSEGSVRCMHFWLRTGMDAGLDG